MMASVPAGTADPDLRAGLVLPGDLGVVVIDFHLLAGGDAGDRAVVVALRRPSQYERAAIAAVIDADVVGGSRRGGTGRVTAGQPDGGSVFSGGAQEGRVVAGRPADDHVLAHQLLGHQGEAPVVRRALIVRTGALQVRINRGNGEERQGAGCAGEGGSDIDIVDSNVFGGVHHLRPLIAKADARVSGDIAGNALAEGGGGIPNQRGANLRPG